MRIAKPMLASRKNYPYPRFRTGLNVLSAMNQCERSIQVSQFISSQKASIQQINNSQPVDNLVQKFKLRLRHAHVIHMLDWRGTLQARASQKAHPEPLRRLARGVAVAIGIALSIANADSTQGSIDPIKSLKELADYQLTDKQYKCHNQIVFRESTNNKFAINGSHYGYYQGRSVSLKGAPDDYQFYWFWSYVSHRYGVTRYDEPDYCKALHHLKAKGWQ